MNKIELVLNFCEYEEFDVVKVNYDGPFLSTKPINLFNSKEQATHLVDQKRVQKKELSIIRFSKSKNVEHDSAEQIKLWKTINKLEKTTKYRLADIREAIKKRKLKKQSIEKKEDHTTYYNSSTKCLKGESIEQWQFQGLKDYSNHTEASPSRIRDVFSWLKKIHCAFLPSLPGEDAELPKYSEEDLLCLMRLHIKDESLLCFDFSSRQDYFEAIEHSLDRIEQNPYLILQYQLYAKNTPKHKVKTFPITDGNLILDCFINRLITLNKLFHSKYPEICVPINPLDNFQEQETFAVLSDSTQNMDVESNSTNFENKESTEFCKKSNLKTLPIMVFKKIEQNGVVRWNLKKRKR